MSGRGALLVAAFPSELPRATGLPSFVCGSRAAWGGAPPQLPGVGDVIVTGSCGALLPGFARGSLVLPERLRSVAGGWLRPDPSLRQALSEAAEVVGHQPANADLAEAETLVDEGQARAALAEWTGCSFVDTESAVLAAAAEAAGRRWAVLRFVSDTPGRPLNWLAELYGGFPATEPGALETLWALARKPCYLPKLLGLSSIVRSGRGAAARVLKSWGA